MRKEDLQVVALTSGKFLLSFFDIAVTPFFSASSRYRKSMKKFAEESGYQKSQINDRIQYLKRIKCIRICTEGKDKYLELLPKGVKKLEKIIINNLSIPRTDTWDKKWRVVIFDVPEKNEYARDFFRLKIVELGFMQIQKSVYVYPFPCTDEVTFIVRKLGLEKYVTIMISEIIQGEEEIIYQFRQKEILLANDLNSARLLKEKNK